MDRIRTLAVCLSVVVGVSCRTGQVAQTPSTQPPPIIQPGAPGQPSQVITAEKAADVSAVEYIDADIKFMQGMIGHHAQALEMVAFIPTHSTRDAMKLLGQRIDISQVDEIKMMQDWLRQRGQQVPAMNAMHMHGATLMPGMLTAEEMERLSKARGDDFDRLFLEGMIKHHEGALTMVQDLFAIPGAGQDVTVFSFANDVDADQRMEIQRMSTLLDTLLKERKQ
jgi:uncharacterized protein (DUF305 family)